MAAFTGAGRRALGRYRGLTPVNKSAFAKKPRGSGEFQPSGLYLFVAHPGCCPICHEKSLTPFISTQPDVNFITHPNCLCSTIEVPAEIAEQGWPAMMEWAKHPYGRMRFGWSYGKALQTVDTTEETAAGFRKQWERNVASGAWRRAEVTDADKRRVRELVKAGSLGRATPMDARTSAKFLKAAGGPWKPQPMKTPRKFRVAEPKSLRSTPATARANLTRLAGGNPLAWMAVGAMAKQAMDEAERRRRLKEKRAAEYRRALGI